MRTYVKTKRPFGYAYLNPDAGCFDLIGEYVRSGNYLRPEYSPVVLLETPVSKVTKLELPGCGTCVLKEMFVNKSAKLSVRFKQWRRLLTNPRSKRTFIVASKARKCGIPVYEPYAFWMDNEHGIRSYFLCEFVHGMSFEDLCQGMNYGPDRRDSVISYFRMLGSTAARLHENGIIDGDMIPRNCIIPAEADGRGPLRLIDMDLAFPVSHCGRRFCFIEKMRSFRRFVSYYPLNNECLDAFLDAYSGGDASKAEKCRNVLEYFRKHSGHRSLASFIAMFRFPVP